MKAWSISVVVLVVSLSLFLIFRKNFNSKNSMEELNQDFRSAESNFKSVKDYSLANTKPKEGVKSSDVQNSPSTGLENNTSPDYTSPVSEVSSKNFYEEYQSENDINSDFISDSGEVYENSLVAAFSGDFLSFIDSIQTLEKGNEAFENQMKLNEELYRQLGNSVFDEKLSCAGKLCAVTLKYFDEIDEIDENALNSIHKFGTFYSFYNYSSDNNGNKQVKLILLSTPDSSNLTLAR